MSARLSAAELEVCERSGIAPEAFAATRRARQAAASKGAQVIRNAYLGALFPGDEPRRFAPGAPSAESLLSSPEAREILAACGLTPAQAIEGQRKTDEIIAANERARAREARQSR